MKQKRLHDNIPPNEEFFNIPAEAERVNFCLNFQKTAFRRRRRNAQAGKNAFIYAV